MMKPPYPARSAVNETRGVARLMEMPTPNAVARTAAKLLRRPFLAGYLDAMADTCFRPDPHFRMKTSPDQESGEASRSRTKERYVYAVLSRRPPAKAAWAAAKRAIGTRYGEHDT